MDFTNTHNPIKKEDFQEKKGIYSNRTTLNLTDTAITNIQVPRKAYFSLHIADTLFPIHRFRKKKNFFPNPTLYIF